jgi:hypothetical protein
VGYNTFKGKGRSKPWNTYLEVGEFYKPYLHHPGAFYALAISDVWDRVKLYTPGEVDGESRSDCKVKITFRES